MKQSKFKKLKNLFLITTYLLSLSEILAQTSAVVTSGYNKYVVLEMAAGKKSGYVPDGYCYQDSLRVNDKVIIINNHNNLYGAEPLRFSANDKWYGFGLSGVPTGTIDRINGTFYNKGAWSSTVNSRLGTQAKYNVAMRVTLTGDQLTVVVSAEALANLSGEYRLNVLVTEDSVVQNQNNIKGYGCYGAYGDSILDFPHMDVLRAYLGTEWGEYICTNPSLNQTNTHTFFFKIPTGFNKSKLKVIGMVQKYDANWNDREIVNAISLKTQCLLSSPKTISLTKPNNQRVCDSVLISTTNAAPYYMWFKNGSYLATTAYNSIYITSSGHYQVITPNGSGCNIDTSNSLENIFFKDEKKMPQLCAVSVDSATGKNEVIWEKYGITRASFYNIYRENSSSKFVLIGRKAYDSFSSFLDTGSYPLQQSYRYKLTITDSCDSETPLDSSIANKTIHLTSNEGINGEVNLIWNLYEGKRYISHDIMRSINNGPFMSIANVSNNNTTYSDLQPPSGQLKYRIDLKTTKCSPMAKKSSYDVISSNAVAIFLLSISHPSKYNVSIYPNPTSDKINIALNGIITKLEITNLLGHKLWSENYSANKITVDISSFEQGIYFIKVNDNYIQKLMKN